jgi:hypothetical protein
VNGTLPRARTNLEIALERQQRLVTVGLIADEERKRVMLLLWENGMTQRELSERMTRASVAAGGGVITENAAYKLLASYRTQLARNGD